VSFRGSWLTGLVFQALKIRIVLGKGVLDPLDHGAELAVEFLTEGLDLLMFESAQVLRVNVVSIAEAVI
jgi:hypothetical protein